MSKHPGTDPANGNGADMPTVKARVNAALAGIESLPQTRARLNDQGVAALEFESNTPVILELSESADVLAVYAMICSLPLEAQTRVYFYEQILRRNLVQPLLGGGSVGTDPEGSALFFSHAIALKGEAAETLTSNSLDKLLQFCLSNVEDIRAFFDEQGAQGETDAENGLRAPAGEAPSDGSAPAPMRRLV